jgi:hypothetical protein
MQRLELETRRNPARLAFNKIVSDLRHRQTSLQEVINWHLEGSDVTSIERVGMQFAFPR